MRFRLIALIIFAAAAGLGAATLARDWMAAQQAAFNEKLKSLTPEETETAEVLVARKAIAVGTFLKPDMFRWAEWPESGVADTYVVRLANPETDQIEDLLGAVMRNSMTAGEPITSGQIIRPGERGFLAAVLTPGSRAVSVPINATTGISGFVFPGDSVDLLLTHTIKGGSNVRRASETILRDIRILAVDQSVANEDGKPVIAKTATLEVLPKQAEKIAVAMEMGTLSLTLRSLPVETAEGEPIIDPTQQTYTWDSQASRLLSGGGRGNGAPVTTVQVVRRGDAQTLSFRGTYQ